MVEAFGGWAGLGVVNQAMGSAGWVPAAGESVAGKRGGCLPPAGAARRLERGGSGSSSSDGAAGGGVPGRRGGVPLREEADPPLHR